MKLKLRLWKEINPNGTAIVFMQILKQEGISENLSSTIRISEQPELLNNMLYLRGSRKELDRLIYQVIFQNIKKADEYIKWAIQELDKVFASLKEGDEILVRDRADQ